MPKAINELQALFRAKGYFNAEISTQVSRNEKQDSCNVKFIIAYGQIARIRNLTIDVNDESLAKTINAYFKNSILYTAAEFNRKIDKTKKLLKQRLYYFPEIKIQEDFLNPQHSLVDIKITIACGYKYFFVFRGMAPRMPLIASIWEQEVFEKWAEAESRSRLLNHLKNKGFLNAEVESAISTQGTSKTIVFTASKNRRYKLGKIRKIHGNRAVRSEKIREIINTDDLIFNKTLLAATQFTAGRHGSIEAVLLLPGYFTPGHPFGPAVPRQPRRYRLPDQRRQEIHRGQCRIQRQPGFFQPATVPLDQKQNRHPVRTEIAQRRCQPAAELLLEQRFR